MIIKCGNKRSTKIPRGTNSPGLISVLRNVCGLSPVSVRHRPNAGLLLAHRLRRWANIKSTLGERWGLRTGRSTCMTYTVKPEGWRGLYFRESRSEDKRSSRLLV